MRGILAGSLLLVALEAALSSDEATSRVGKMWGHLADLSRRLIDPSVAAIPDVTAGAGAVPTGAGTSSSNGTAKKLVDSTRDPLTGGFGGTT